MGKLLGREDRVEIIEETEDLEIGTKATVTGFTADRKVGIRVDETNQLCYVPFESLRKIET
jgi:DNA transposition AAA+ family ATPase